MRKTAKIQTETEIEICECDICGKNTKGMYGVSRVCHLCKRDICYDCGEYDSHDDSDYPDFFCKSCWNNGMIGYYEEKEAADFEHDRKCQKMYDKWKEVALKALEKK